MRNLRGERSAGNDALDALQEEDVNEDSTESEGNSGTNTDTEREGNRVQDLSSLSVYVEEHLSWNWIFATA